MPVLSSFSVFLLSYFVQYSAALGWVFSVQFNLSANAQIYPEVEVEESKSDEADKQN